MKAAYLVLAHHQPGQLARLVKHLICPWSAVFIHVDKKSSVAPFRAAVPEHPQVNFLEDPRRVRVHWGGFSIVRATLELLKAATSHPVRFDRFCLLSGADFPIKEPGQIRERFQTDLEFIRVDRRLDENQDGWSRWVRFYWFPDSLDVAGDRLLSGRAPRTPYRGLPLYHGSAWWSLTRNCVNHILGFVAKQGDYCRFHQHTLCPDEIFFHSIIKNSPFAANMSHDFESRGGFPAGNVHGCHYIDWNAAGVRLPKVLDRGDIDALLGSEALFARKFELQVSREVYAAIADRIAAATSFPPDSPPFS